MDSLFQDLRLALRILAKRPGFTTVTVLTLALAIGANTAIFSVVDAVLLRPLPYPHPERLVTVTETVRRERVEERSVAYPDFLDWRKSAGVFDAIAAFQPTSFTLTGGETPERVEGEMVSPAYFDLLGVQAELGRTFLPQEDEPLGGHPVALLGHDLWQRRFGADRTAVGSTITLNGTAFSVVGVLPAGFRGLDDDTEAWIPMAMMGIDVPAAYATRRGSRWHDVIARLAPGVDLRRAQAALDTLSARLESEYPDSNDNYGARAIPYAERRLGNFRAPLWMLLGAVAFVLLLACANVANLTLTSAAARQRQTAIRAALGAGRGRLVRHFLTEGVTLSVLGGLAGGLVAMWGVDLLLAASPVELPSFVHVHLDLGVLAFSAALTLATGLVLGAAPAFQAVGLDLNETLKEGGRGGGTGTRQGRLRALLVVAEVAVALPLLIGAGLMVESFRRMEGIDPGFSPDGALIARLPLPAERYDKGRAAPFESELLARVGALPGVSAAALATDVPLGGDSSAVIVGPEGASEAVGDQGMRVYLHAVSPGFFAATGIRLLGGRDFGAGDVKAAPGVIVVSQSFARRAWPGEDPIGKRVELGRPSGKPDTANMATVIAVAGDAHYRALVPNPTRNPSDPDVYFSLAQIPRLDLALVVRAAGEAAALGRAVTATVLGLDRDVPVYGVETLTSLASRQTAATRFTAGLMSVFGALALLLAAIGIYGVLSDSVAQRRHEIGVRMALGARRGEVFRQVLGRALALALAGAGIGLAGAWGLTRLLASQLYGVSPTDPTTFAGLAALLVGVALLATWLPARRATRIDPVVALRYE